MANVEYLKKHNLWEAHEHFMRLSEAYIPTAEAVIGEADADVVVAEVAPRGGLLVGGLVGTEAVLVVEDILELQA